LSVPKAVGERAPIERAHVNDIVDGFFDEE
jgi:hypothetical protein